MVPSASRPSTRTQPTDVDVSDSPSTVSKFAPQSCPNAHVPPPARTVDAGWFVCCGRTGTAWSRRSTPGEPTRSSRQQPNRYQHHSATPRSPATSRGWSNSGSSKCIRKLPRTAAWLAHHRLCAGGGGRYQIETSLRPDRHMEYHTVSFAISAMAYDKGQG